jgi:hypothetical protein
MARSATTVKAAFERAVEARCGAAAAGAVPRRRRKNAFKQTDVTRAVKAARAAGVEIGAVKIDQVGPNSSITIIPAGKTPEAGSELDKWISEHADSTEGS